MQRIQDKINVVIFMVAMNAVRITARPWRTAG